MATIRTKDGVEIYYRDWGEGSPVMFSHAWPLTGEAFENQMFFLASRGFRCIAHDRRGHGRSSQPWIGNNLDTHADDLATLVTTLDLSGVTLVGHSTGGGEIARYIGRHGTMRVARTVLISSITPLMLQTPSNPEGVPKEIFNEFRRAILADRSQFWMDLSLRFFGYNRPNQSISQGVRDSFWKQGMMAGFPASYFCVKAFSETDLTADLSRFDIPTLVIHGDDDQIVPFRASAQRTARLVKGAVLKSYIGAPHGLCTTHKDQINADLIGFIRGSDD